MFTGLMIAILGLAMSGWYFFFFEITAPNSRIVNLGLMSDKQNGLVLGLGLAFVGILIAIAVKIIIPEARALVKRELVVWAKIGKLLAVVIAIGAALVVLGNLFTAASNWFDERKQEEKEAERRLERIAENKKNRLRREEEEASAHRAQTGREIGLKVLPPVKETIVLKKTTDQESKIIEEARSENLALQNENIQLREANSRLALKDSLANTEIISLKESISSERLVLSAEVKRLKNNLSVADELAREKELTIQEMLKIIRKLKESSASDESAPDSVRLSSSSSAQEHITQEKHWANVPSFAPVRYKADLLRRLSLLASERKLSGVKPDTRIEIQFVIRSDGQPEQIVSSDSVASEIQKQCVSYIAAAGPFKPLFTPELKNLQVIAEIVPQYNSTIEIRNLHIAALGNRL